MITKVPASPGVLAHTKITLDQYAIQVMVDVKKNEQGANFTISDKVDVVETYSAKPNETVVVDLDPKATWAYQVSYDGIKWYTQFKSFGWSWNFVLDNQTMPESWGRWTKVA